MTSTTRFSQRHSRGQTAVEFALVLPLLVLLLVGIFDFGRVIFGSNDASYAAREATRFASVSPRDCDTMFHAVQTQMHNEGPMVVVVSYRPEPSFSNQNPAWTNVCPAYDPATRYDKDPTTGTMSGISPRALGEIRVSVTNPVTLATPIISNLVGGTVTVTGSSTMVITFVPS